jgi:1-aminocyclopropane-1-carboxylate deaminase/D-cysteine desulfhydrase-like pyridoxal-dependent ACC family enzyme
MHTTTQVATLDDMHALTPVEKHGELYFKRDDLLQPYPDSPVNGGKLRQCYFLLERNAQLIASQHNNTVATATSVHSPQGAIVARVAQSLGMRCIVAIGGNEKSHRHSTVKWCTRAGADVRVVTKMGYTSILNAKILQMPEHPFLVHFGMNLERDPDAILRSTAAQVANVPADTDNIVFAVGSGIVMGGVLLGVAQRTWAKAGWPRCIGIQISGYDRSARIGATSGWFDWQYELFIDKTFPYAHEVKCKIDDTLTLDPIYEAKAFVYMRDTLHLDGKTLFWVVGNSAPLRQNNLQKNAK